MIELKIIMFWHLDLELVKPQQEEFLRNGYFWYVLKDRNNLNKMAYPWSYSKNNVFCFRVHYGSATIDWFELFKPSNSMACTCTWLQYKHYNTTKYLIPVRSQGVINFTSKRWGGHASDQYITDHNGFLWHVLSSYDPAHFQCKYIELLDVGENERDLEITSSN